MGKRKKRGAAEKPANKSKDQEDTFDDSSDGDGDLEYIDPERGLEALKRRGAPQALIDKLRNARIAQNEKILARSAAVPPLKKQKNGTG